MTNDEAIAFLAEREKCIKDFNKNHDGTKLNIFSRIMFMIAKWCLRFGYERLSVVIPEDVKTKTDEAVDSITAKQPEFEPNRALDELLKDSHYKGNRVLNAILLIIDAIISISVIAAIGFAVYHFGLLSG